MNFPGRNIAIFSLITSGCLGGYALATVMSQNPSQSNNIAATTAQTAATTNQTTATQPTQAQSKAVQINNTEATASVNPSSNATPSGNRPTINKIDNAAVDKKDHLSNQQTGDQPTADNSQISEQILITPGKRLGLVDFKTTYAQLIRVYGPDRLSDSITYGPEGMGQWPATTVKLGQGYEFKVTWKTKQKQKITQIDIGPNGEKWRTADGIGIGSKFSKLQQELGEFNIPGFGWDYGNRVLSKHPKMKGVSLMLAIKESVMQTHRQEYRAVAGDQMIKSTDPRLQNLAPTVSRITIYERTDRK